MRNNSKLWRYGTMYQSLVWYVSTTYVCRTYHQFLKTLSFVQKSPTIYSLMFFRSLFTCSKLSTSERLPIQTQISNGIFHPGRRMPRFLNLWETLSVFMLIIEFVPKNPSNRGNFNFKVNLEKSWYCEDHGIRGPSVGTGYLHTLSAQKFTW